MSDDPQFIQSLSQPTLAALAVKQAEEIRHLREMMPLAKAISILARSHTKDDDYVGFHVFGIGIPQHHEISRSEYIEAWRSLRFNIGMQTEPKKSS